jgi:hypothetical protein
MNCGSYHSEIRKNSSRCFRIFYQKVTVLESKTFVSSLRSGKLATTINSLLAIWNNWTSKDFRILVWLACVISNDLYLHLFVREHSKIPTTPNCCPKYFILKQKYINLWHPKVTVTEICWMSTYVHKQLTIYSCAFVDIQYNVDLVNAQTMDYI